MTSSERTENKSYGYRSRVGAVISYVGQPSTTGLVRKQVPCPSDEKASRKLTRTGNFRRNSTNRYGYEGGWCNEETCKGGVES